MSSNIWQYFLCTGTKRSEHLPGLWSGKRPVGPGLGLLPPGGPEWGKDRKKLGTEKATSFEGLLQALLISRCRRRPRGGGWCAEVSRGAGTVPLRGSWGWTGLASSPSPSLLNLSFLPTSSHHQWGWWYLLFTFCWLLWGQRANGRRITCKVTGESMLCVHHYYRVITSPEDSLHFQSLGCGREPQVWGMK